MASSLDLRSPTGANLWVSISGATCAVVSKVLPPLTTPIGATPARRRAGACCQPLGVTSHFMEARAGPREPKPSRRRTRAKFLPAESPSGRRGAGRGTPQPWRATMGGVFGFLSGSTNAASRVTPFRPGALTLDVNAGCQTNSRAASGMWPSRDRPLFSATFALRSMSAPSDMLHRVEVVLLLPPRSLLGGQSHCKGRARF